MPSPFKTLGAVLCLLFALSFAAPNAHADTFTYTYTATLSDNPTSSYSWTTGPIPVVTGETILTAAQLTAVSVTGGFTISGCTITTVVLNASGAGNQATVFFGLCPIAGGSLGSIISADALPLANYSTPGSYTSVFNNPSFFVKTDTLVVSAVQTPEPSSLALMLSGVGLVFGMRKRWGLSLAS